MIVDDENLLSDFPGHVVYCYDAWMTDPVRDRIIRIFQRGMS
ncbi:MAG: hypothetical protein PUG68_09665 [Lachnospiraceae bacterium]|nr:hypothetical protein [Lachnospiraceae bacterium]MDY2760196.1 hypothetical protein [Lachnospiraceae bacterium]